MADMQQPVGSQHELGFLEQTVLKLFDGIQELDDLLGDAAHSDHK